MEQRRALRRIMKRAVFILILAAMLAAAAHSADVRPVQTTLTNGMTVVVTENHSAPVVAIRFYVKTGSLYEGRMLGHGLSHYIEHTLFLGTTNRTRAQIEETTQAIGNASNAYTSEDHCCYYITTATQYWETGLDLMGDLVFHANFPQDLLTAERGVILREIAMDTDEPETRVYWLFNETMFHVHPVRVPVIGFGDLLGKTTRDELVNYHAERYVPDNVIVSIAGDVTAKAATDKCRELYEKIPRQPPPPIVLPAEPPQTAPRREVRVDEHLEKAYLLLGYRTIPLLNPDLFALDVLADVLGSGASSRLVRIVREEKQLVDGISAFSDTPSYDAGSFGVSAQLAPDKLPEAESAILAEIERCRTGLITAEELDRAKTEKESQLIYARETTDGLAESVGVDMVTTGDPLFGEHYVEGIRRVTRQDVQRVAAAYLRPEKLCVVALTPKAPRAARAESAGGAGQAAIVKKTLPNGLTVLIQQSRTAPTISLFAAAKAGLRFETEKTNGLTAFTANMLTRGTKTRSREALAQAVEDMGASLAPFSGSNSLGVSAKGLSRNLDQILNLTADVLMNATFPASEFEARKHFTLAGIQAQQDDPNAIARRYFLEHMYTVHPYRFLTIGTEESVKALTREQVVDYYATYCRPNRTVLALFGDVDPETGFAAVERALGKWQPQAAKEPTPPAEPPLETVREARQERDQQQVIIYVGFPGITGADPRRYAVDVLNAVLAGKGYPGGRLFPALRERQLVYSASARSEAGLDPGAFVIYAATLPGKADEVLSVIRRVVGEFRDAPVGEEELTRGKQMCTAEYEIDLQSSGSRAQSAVLGEIYGLGYDDYQKYAERIAKVTSEDVKRAADELLNLDKCVITIVGPKG